MEETYKNHVYMLTFLYGMNLSCRCPSFLRLYTNKILPGPFLYMLDTSVAYYTNATVVDVWVGAPLVERLVHNRSRRLLSFSRQRTGNVFFLCALSVLAFRDGQKKKSLDFLSLFPPSVHERERDCIHQLTLGTRRENKKERDGREIGRPSYSSPGAGSSVCAF
jgi:hypothetical protein